MTKTDKIDAFEYTVEIRYLELSRVLRISKIKLVGYHQWRVLIG